MSLPFARHMLRSDPRTPAAALRAALHTSPPLCRSAPATSTPSSSSAPYPPPPRGVRSAGRAPLLKEQVQARAAGDARQIKKEARLLEQRILGNSCNQSARLVPGDAVELRVPASVIGIVLPTPPSRGGSLTRSGGEVCLLLPWGIVQLYLETDVTLRLPSLVDGDLAAQAAPADISHIPSTFEGMDPTQSAAVIGEEREPFDPERFGARTKACAALRALLRMSETEMLRLRPAFRQVCLSQEGLALIEDEGTAHTPAVARTILQRTLASEGCSDASTLRSARVTQPVYLAVHRMLMDAPSRFVADDTAHRTSQRFSLRSERERAAIEAVDAWARAPHGSEGWAILEGFAQRAKQVLAWRAALGEEKLHAEQPERVELSAQDGPGVEWSETDRVVLQFLRTTLATRRSLQGYKSTPVAMTVLKRAGANMAFVPVAHSASHPERCFTHVPAELASYGRDLGDASFDLACATALRFLQHVGAMAPWENDAMLQSGIDFATSERENVRESASESEASEAKAATYKPKLALHEAETERFDFEQLRVEVIDEASAHELDDGISVERVAGKDEVWIHVHVADPTSLIDPGDELARRARRQHNTIYLPEGRWPLLPDELLFAGRLSIGAKNETEAQREERMKHGMRVVTFSARVDAQGKVQQYHVRPSIVRNVHVTTYDDVSAALAVEGDSDLHLLQRFTRALLHRRVANSSIASSRPKPSFTLSPSSLPASPSPPSTHVLFRGFPSVQLAPAQRAPLLPSLAQNVVSECMILAGRIAGAAAFDRGVPVVYRAQEAPPLAQAEQLSALRDADGTMHWLTLLRSGVRLAAGTASASPANHYALGISPALDDAAAHGGYARSTSPLRRYPDIVAHWQLKASLAGRPAPWSQERLEADIPRLARMDAWAANLERRVLNFWVSLALRRLLDAPRETLSEEELALLGPLDAVVALPNVRINPSRLDSRTRVMIPALGINADCAWARGTLLEELGKPLKVKLHDVIRSGIRSAVVVVPADWE